MPLANRTRVSCTAMAEVCPKATSRPRYGIKEKGCLQESSPSPPGVGDGFTSSLLVHGGCPGFAQARARQAEARDLGVGSLHRGAGAPRPALSGDEGHVHPGCNRPCPLSQSAARAKPQRTRPNETTEDLDQPRSGAASAPRSVFPPAIAASAEPGLGSPCSQSQSPICSGSGGSGGSGGVSTAGAPAPSSATQHPTPASTSPAEGAAASPGPASAVPCSGINRQLP